MNTIENKLTIDLVKKYDVYAFDYIEYPHKSFWSEKFNDNDFRTALKTYKTNPPPSVLYVHIPFCEQRCYFCICHTEITKDYGKIKRYLNNSLYPVISGKKIEQFTIEIDPRRVNKEKMQFYHSRGVNKISIGVQDILAYYQTDLIKEEVLKSFNKRNVLITGGTGLIGRQVVEILCGADANVVIVSLDNINVHNKVQHIIGDLTSFDFCKEITKDMDFVFHLAGIKGSIEIVEKKPATIFVTLLMMNTNILEACKINKVKKVVYTSIIRAYSSAEIFKEPDYRIDGMPMELTSWSKRMAELQIHTYKLQYNLDNFTIVRPANVYGPGDNFDPKNAMVIPSLMCRIYSKEDSLVVWGDGSAVRDKID